MSMGGLLPSSMLATSGLGSDNNNFMADVFMSPDGSGPNGSAVPGLGTNPNDPTQVGDTGSTVAADTTSGFDVNQFFDSLFTNALKGYQLANSGPGRTTFTPQQQFQLQQQQLALKAQQTQSQSSQTTFLVLIVAGMIVVVLIFTMRKA